MRFWLGVHKPHWLRLAGVPLFVSARRLREYKTPPVATCEWALDSGGFTEIAMHGCWETSPKQYADEASRWQEACGRIAFAAPQDWMCEPVMLAKTGFTVAEHQARTIASYHDLRRLAIDVPWIPVLQGWHLEDYLAHVEAYREAGVDLAALPLVGLGSVCRRQGMDEAEEIVRALAALGIRLHGFGFKLTGLARCRDVLASSDSMAWSLDARRSAPLPGHTHKSCANCLEYAIAWRGKVDRLLARPPAHR